MHYPLPKTLRRKGLNLRLGVVWIVVVCVVESLCISKLEVSGLIVVGEVVTQSRPRIRPNTSSPLCTQDKGFNVVDSLGDVIVVSISSFGEESGFCNNIPSIYIIERAVVKRLTK